MKQRKQIAGIRRLSVLAPSLIAVAAINTAAALTKVDVLVAYDTTASAWLTANSKTAADFAAEQVDKMNEVLKNSGLGGIFEFRCVGVHEATLAYDYSNGFSGVLANLTDSQSAPYAAVRAARDSAGADVAMFLVDGGGKGTAGLSNGMEPYVNGSRQYGLSFDGADQWLAWFAERAYGICDITSVQNGHTLVHEVGHIMGAGHSDLLSFGVAYLAAGPQLYSYSKAYMYDSSDGKSYATVMGYSSNGSGDGKRYQVLPYFSSPDLANPYSGEALGDASHNNVATLRQTCKIVAGFREAKETDSAPSVDPTPTPDPAPDPVVDPLSPTVKRGFFDSKKTVISGAIRNGDSVVGVVLLTVAQTKNGFSKVSGNVVGMDGKKQSVKAGKCQVYGGTVATVQIAATVKGYSGVLRAVLGSDGSISDGSIGNMTVENADVGALSSDSLIFTVDEPLPSVGGVDFIKTVEYGDATYYALPYSGHGEAVAVSGGKWAVIAKAGKLKFKKNNKTKEQELVLDMGKDGSKTNLSGLKLSFAGKTASFKGSFTAYAIVNAKLKKFKFAVSGIVVDGVGIGIAYCKNLNLTVPVSVQ